MQLSNRRKIIVVDWRKWALIGKIFANTRINVIAIKVIFAFMCWIFVFIALRVTFVKKRMVFMFYWIVFMWRRKPLVQRKLYLCVGYLHLCVGYLYLCDGGSHLCNGNVIVVLRPPIYASQTSPKERIIQITPHLLARPLLNPLQYFDFAQ